ncbi:unnamed protein product (mitochondrion) [Plasmodiophora brassicae]|uniref:Peptide deformylase n=1 Tax=Plasmodiophora brassicae TaxID=37360 RepID=A0A0G4IS24_PLABS|nr:hypothetical protein PBRA_006025 [Plasmodiophora brassicae]SPQ98127.1 unnamed protein product [Plasmodiophora brassicae]
MAKAAQAAKKAFDLVFLGNSVLRRTSLPVDVGAITKPETKELMAGMRKVLASTEYGIGLAAPQVGHNVRMLLYLNIVENDLTEEGTERDSLDHFPPPIMMINPVITDRSVEMVNEWEQCLSVPEFTGLVPRHASVSVDYYDEDGVARSVNMKGQDARTVQHEIDHLDGVLFIDRVDLKTNLFVTKEYERILAENPREIVQHEYPDIDFSDVGLSSSAPEGVDFTSDTQRDN